MVRMAVARRRLVERREELGLTQAQVAEALDSDAKTIGRYERGETTPRHGQRLRYARALDWTAAQLALALDGDGQSAVHRGPQVLESLSLLAALEQSASQLRAFQPFAVPGLLQTAAYATAVERADPIPSDVARLVELRIARQAVLSREPTPLRLSVVLDESALLRVAGERHVMATQLDRLAARAELPNVELRVLPLGAGAFAAAFGSFTILSAEGATEPYIVCLADRTGFRYDESRAGVEAHAALFDHLRELALTPGDSLGLIHATAKERYR
jgi:transcriptional regulator with XRE-family HTH domain